MRPGVGLVALAICFAGCLDFDQFRVSTELLPPRDATALDRPGVEDASEVATPLDAGVDVTTLDRPGSCAPGPEMRVRLAHMAVGFGPVTLCERRNVQGYYYAAVSDESWPLSGLQYLQVSQPAPTNTRVQSVGEPWQFAVVPAGQDCSQVERTLTPLASVSVRVDPRSHATLVLTSQPTVEGGMVAALGFLPDRACAECPQGSVDIRAVHASLGANADRLSFAIRYNTPPDFPVPMVNVFFANNVPYGSTAITGGQGYECDTAWWSATNLPTGYPIQFSVRALGGGEVAQSIAYLLKPLALRASRLATLFFAGTHDDPLRPLTFVLCYDGVSASGLTSCETIATATNSLPSARNDAGYLGDASVSPPELDAAAPDVEARLP
ncbi:MAG: hypothetical protein JNK72_18000 [Myxococcales bacterium]|nr:hypothetical protein [Myxococcales bacterium]